MSIENKNYQRPRKRRNSRPPNWRGLFIALWLALAIPELVLHMSTAQGLSTFFNAGFFLAPLFAAVPAMLVLAVTLLIPKRKVNRIIVIVYCSVTFFLCASQLIYYRVFGTFYSAYSMANGGQVLQFWNIILKKIFQNILLLALMALPTVTMVLQGRRWFTFAGAKKKQLAVVPFVAAILVQLLIVLVLPIFGGTGNMSAYDLYHSNSDSYFSLNRLGFLTSFRLDVTRLVTGAEVGGDISLNTPDTTTEPDGTDGTTGESAETTESQPQETEPPFDSSPNVLEIDFESLIEKEDRSKVADVHRYFAGRTPSNKNEKTGLFKGCNLILITAEAFSGLIINEERTPILYKMQTEGYTFTNYYVPDWGTSTTDGEYGHLTGTVPKSNTWSFSDSSDNYMPLTMCQQLKKLGYGAYAYHGHTYSYYDRNEYLENLGYKYRAYGQGLDVEKVWPESDVEVVDLSTEDFAANEPFTAYYMTISGHREFTFRGNTIAYRNRELVADEPYSDNVRAYLSCQLELEKSLALLMSRLEKAGTLDNTVFVLTADHYPNGLTVEEISELAGHEIETNFEIFKNNLIIYKPGMTPETIEAPTSHLDILPTLSNLFGLEFDSRLYMGRDVFSDAEPLVMFRNRSWITDKASYNFNTGEVINRTAEQVDESYVDRISKELSNRFAVSSRILDYDYWDIIFD